MDTKDDWQSGKTLAETNRIMFDNELATDVSFVFSGSKETVRAHKVILMSRSYVFFVMFNSRLQEPDKDVEIQEIEPAIFKDLLRFLYCEDVSICAENALHLLYSAQKYQVEQLKAKCLDFLQNNLDVSTVGLILDQAIFYNEVQLYRTCLDFFSNHSIRSIKRLNDYHISKETLEMIIGCDSLWVDELYIVNACDAWAITECKNKGLDVSGENKRKVLGPILKKIRFCSMTNEEIASQVSPRGLLAPEEELEIFRYIGAPATTPPPFPEKERISLHAMLPPELGKSPGSPMLQHLTSTNGSFHIYVTCSKEFKLLGLFFTRTGHFKIRFNEETSDEFLVPKADVNMFLVKSVSCDKSKAMDIREQSVDGKAHKRNESYSFSCKSRVNRTDNVFVTYSVTRYDHIPIPFNALILAL